MTLRSRKDKSSKDVLLPEKIPKESTTPSSVWAPNPYTAMKILATFRLTAAIFSNISDCDETFNYWEPMHYMIHGEGRRTWEYHPDYALRSYGYIWMHVVPLKFYTMFAQHNKIMQFYVMRCLLAFFHSFCEMKFYKSIVHHYGPNAGRIVLLISLFSCGQFISCSAFLPSSFCACTTMLAYAGWLAGDHALAVAGVGAGAILGWPFAAVLGFVITTCLWCLRF